MVSWPDFKFPPINLWCYPKQYKDWFNEDRAEDSIEQGIIMEEKITISKSDYENLLDSARWSNALSAAGVADWSGYEFAQDLVEEMRKEECEK